MRLDRRACSLGGNKGKKTDPGLCASCCDGIHTFGMKKSLGNGEWGYSWRKKQKTIKEKRSGEWGHLLREKKRLLQTKDYGEWGHTFGMKKKSSGSGEWGHS